MKIAVTGGNGRIGRAVIQLAIAEGHEVVNIDRVAVEESDVTVPFVQLDTTDYDAFVAAIKGCDALIHLAAIPGPGRHPEHIVHNNNVVSSYNALRAAVEVGIKRVCQASSINAIGGAYSQWPHYDYFPVDEAHPTYNDEPYSLSKWICEKQADSIVRRYEDMVIASLRIHGFVQRREDATRWQTIENDVFIKHLWGYSVSRPTAQAFLLSVTADFTGHEVFYIVAPKTMMDVPSIELRDKHFPDVPVTGDLGGYNGFFDCRKAERLLGWRHEDV